MYWREIASITKLVEQMLQLFLGDPGPRPRLAGDFEEFYRSGDNERKGVDRKRAD